MTNKNSIEMKGGMNKMSQSIKREYERIGSWDVGLDIPQEIRDQIREDFDYLGRRKFSPGTIVNMGLGRMHLDRLLKEGKSLDEAFKLTSDTFVKKAESFYEYYDEFLNSRGEYANPNNREIAEKRYNGKDNSYAYHRLIGSTTHLTPDPFVRQDSYFLEHPRDQYGDVGKIALATAKHHRDAGRKDLANELESGLIVGEQFLQPYQNYVPSFELVKMQEDGREKEYERIWQQRDEEYKTRLVRTTINWKTREARIDPK